MTNQDRPPVLGKGLGSLIPGAVPRGSWGHALPTVSTEERIEQVSADAISANPWQPRTSFDHDRLEELAKSIKEYGIIQPLIVTLKAPGQYQLVAGERRLKAAKIVGLPQVPVVVRKLEDQKKLEVSLIENLQRHNLNPVEEAFGFKRLMDEFNLTQEEVGERVGKSRPTVANFLRLLTLPREILDALTREEITFSHAKVILSYETEREQLRAFKKIMREGLTVAQATKPTPKRTLRTQDPVLASWEEKLTERLGFQAHIKKEGSGGKIEIPYRTEEDLKQLLDTLLKN